MVNGSLYYAFSFINDLAGDIYLNFFIAGLVEFPAYILIYWSNKRWGRRPTLVSLMLVAGASCVAIMCVPANLEWLSTTFAMVGKFCISGSFGLLYFYTTEVFPTDVRNVTLGCCSMGARIGSILVPFVSDLVSIL
ncbi:UNVERIFIED_CONTAM: Orct [Trichonephila clavipes]